MKISKGYNEMEWLSDYMDDRLSAEDKAAFNKLISEDQSLNISLETLETSRVLLKTAPKRSAPHNFTISATVASKLRKQRINVPILRFSSAFSTALSIIIFAFAFFFNRQAILPSSMIIAAPAAEKSVAEEAAAQPQIILWGDQTHGGGGGPAPFGKGGGGGGDSQQLMGVESAPLPAAVAESEVLPEDTTLPAATEEFSLEAPEESVDTQTSPPVADEPPALQPEETLSPGFTVDQENNRDIEQPGLSGSGPILGLDPSSSSETTQDRMSNQSNETAPDSTIWLVSAFSLLLAGIITGIAALILNRKIT